MNGGEVIASGGFGCVFHPRLECVKEPTNIDNAEEYITKLMMNKEAKQEFKTIKKFDKLLKNVKNHKRYYLTSGVNKCKIKELKKKDLKNYTKKCKTLQKHKITKKNINAKRKELTALLIPHGGMELSKFIVDMKDKEEYLLLLSLLLDLMENAVLPMNKMNVHHQDIKSSNLLIKDNNIKIIDWGIAFVQSNKKRVHPFAIGRPFQFNSPFSIVLFNEMFDAKYRSFLTLNGDPSRESIREFVDGYVEEWNKERGPGSLVAMQMILFGESKNLENGNTEVAEEVLEYLTNVLKRFTFNGEFDKMKYYRTVYLKNLDLWGFLSTFGYLYYILRKERDKLSNFQQDVLSLLTDLYTYAIKMDSDPMDPTHLSKEISSFLTKNSKSLGDLAREVSAPKTNKSQKMSLLKKMQKMKMKSRKNRVEKTSGQKTSANAGIVPKTPPDNYVRKTIGKGSYLPTNKKNYF